MSELMRTPLYEEHKALGARFVPFGQWEMPMQYSGILEEHKAVRSAAGLFDVSHMGQIRVHGKDALVFLQEVFSNDIGKIVSGQAIYGMFLNEEGGVIDDVIVYQLSGDDYFLCVNASNVRIDDQWLNAQAIRFSVAVENHSARYGQIAIQGPCARRILADYLSFSPEQLAADAWPPFRVKILRQKNNDLIIATTGYTGEDGFEIYCPIETVVELWRGILAVGKSYGLLPIGLGARDTLRLEACYPLHGHELRTDINAISSGQGWAIAQSKENFIGKRAIIQAKENGTKYCLVGIEVKDPGIVRAETRIYRDGREIGWVASGTMCPTIGKALALAFLESEFANFGTKVYAQVRDKQLLAEVIKKPFYKRGK
ncbi:MAG: glycine cleavage system aminomethyltransferase GcvT [Deltaproteobacteria bacterium]|nr:glycine cleavage system aminomethyltransferase GcvT [Deltaproteobacteria bacterium]